VEASIGLASSFLEVSMYRKVDPMQTQKFLEEANNIIATASSIMANEGNDLTSKDLYDLVERIERARNLLLTVGDRKRFTEQGHTLLDMSSQEVRDERTRAAEPHRTCLA